MPEPSSNAGTDEVLVPFSQVHRVISNVVGSHFWRLQEGNSSDDEEEILAEVAVELTSSQQKPAPSDEVSNSSQSNGHLSSRHESSQNKSELYRDTIAAGYSHSELRATGLLPNKRSGQWANMDRPWQGPLPPPRLSPPVTMGDVMGRAHRKNQPRADRAEVLSIVLPVQNLKVQPRADQAEVPPMALPVQNSNGVVNSLPSPSQKGPTFLSELMQSQNRSGSLGNGLGSSNCLPINIGK